MTVEVRPIGPGDEDLFARVAEGVFDHPVARKQLAHYLATPDHLLVVAIVAGEIVGQVAAVVHRHPDGRPTELYIDEVAVTPALQRQGIARRMLESTLARGRAHGCKEMWVGTEVDNVAAKGLYSSLGASADTFVMYVKRFD